MPIDKVDSSLAAPALSDSVFTRTLSVWDPGSRCRFVAARPSMEPKLWGEYLEGAVAGYRRYGAEKALEYSKIRDGSTTAVFFVALDADGSVVAGVRAQGPYLTADEAHAVTEWGTHEGAPDVRRMIEDRLAFGVVEAKGAWVSDQASHRRQLVGAIGRFAAFSMELLNVQFMMATAGTHVLDAWRSSGGVVAEHIHPVPYPDERYQTRLMWWDRRRRRDRAATVQLDQLLGRTPGYVPSTSAELAEDAALSMRSVS